MAYLKPSVEKIFIDAVDVTNYRYDGNVVKTKQPVKTGNFKFNINISDVITVNDLIIGKIFTWMRGFTTADRCIFRGEITSYKKTGSTYEISVADKLYATVRLELEYTYDWNTDTEAGVGSEIAKDLITEAGLSCSTLSVPTTGTTTAFIIKQYPAKGTILDSLKDLANNYGRRIFYKDSDDLVYFTQDTYETTTTILTVGTNVVNRVQWLTSGEDIVNNLTVVGAEQVDWNTETFTTTGITNTFTLAAIPLDTQIYLGTALLARGIDSSDPKDYYVLSDQKKVVFTTNPTGTLEINYSYNIPAKVLISDDVSITNYTQHDRTVMSDKILTSDDGELLGSSLIDEGSSPITSAPLKVIENNDLEINQIVRVVDQANNKDEDLVVTQISYYSPYRPDEVMVGKRPVGKLDIDVAVLNNLEKLNRQVSNNSDISVQILNVPGTVEISGWVKIERATPTTGVLYLDSANQGDWDEENWGDDSNETYSETGKVYINGVTTT
jgi:hypothetical protein